MMSEEILSKGIIFIASIAGGAIVGTSIQKLRKAKLETKKKELELEQLRKIEHQKQLEEEMEEIKRKFEEKKKNDPYKQEIERLIRTADRLTNY